MAKLTKHNELKINELKTKIHFLSLIPDTLFLTLNFNEFYPPNRDVNLIRKLLEKEFNCYIMSYHKTTDKTKLKTNLCNLIYPAKLTKTQTTKLIAYEAKLCDVVLVAYAKPLRFIAR